MLVRAQSVFSNANCVFYVLPCIECVFLCVLYLSVFLYIQCVSCVLVGMCTLAYF